MVGSCLELYLFYYHTFLEAVSGNKKANNGPFNKFKWMRNIAVTDLLGAADNR